MPSYTASNLSHQESAVQDGQMKMDGAQSSQEMPEVDDDVCAPREVFNMIAREALLDPNVLDQILANALKLGEQREKRQTTGNRPPITNHLKVKEQVGAAPSSTDQPEESSVSSSEEKEQPVASLCSLQGGFHQMNEGTGGDVAVEKLTEKDERNPQVHCEMVREEMTKKMVKRAPRAPKKRRAPTTSDPCHNYATRQKRSSIEPAQSETKKKVIDDPEEEERSRPKHKDDYFDNDEEEEDEEEEEVQLHKNVYTEEELKDMMGSCDEVRSLIRSCSYLPELTEYVFYELCRQALKGLITKNMFREELIQLLFVARDILLKFNWAAIGCKIWFKSEADGENYYSLRIPYLGKKNYPIGESIIIDYKKQFKIAKRKHSEGIKSSDYFAQVHLF